MAAFPEAFRAKYEPRGLLGAGGMGEVWRAHNGATGADVALKVRRATGPDDRVGAQSRDRFRNEARLGARLAHRHIVRVYDLLEASDGTLGLVLELLRGESLSAYLERVGSLPSTDALAIVVPILRALAHAHASGIVHRDVTPANVFLSLDPDGHLTPKLLDFGIAKSTGASQHDLAAPVQTIEGTVLGTPRYMAPERIRGATAVDPRSDIFSAAVILYEALTGVSPFEAATSSGSLAAVLERDVDPDPRIDPRLWNELRRAIAKQPYERHASANELARALCEAMGESEDDYTARPLAVAPIQEHADRTATQTPAEGRTPEDSLRESVPTMSASVAHASGARSPMRTQEPALARADAALLRDGGEVHATGAPMRDASVAHTTAAPGREGGAAGRRGSLWIVGGAVAGLALAAAIGAAAHSAASDRATHDPGAAHEPAATNDPGAARDLGATNDPGAAHEPKSAPDSTESRGSAQPETMPPAPSSSPLAPVGNRGGASSTVGPRAAAPAIGSPPVPGTTAASPSPAVHHHATHGEPPRPRPVATTPGF